MRKLLLLAYLPAVLALESCSIKENRAACPGWLNLRLSERSLSLAGKYPTLIMVLHRGGADTVSLSTRAPGEWIQVAKGGVEIRAMLGNGASEPSAWGEECDSLWTFSSSFPLEEEETSVEISLHKRFATVWFIFDGAPDTDLSRILIRSPGDFRCLMDASSGEASARLPAGIGGTSLVLSCLSPDGNGTLGEWDLGAALLAAGYDWGAEDLSDARVRVSLAPLDISVLVVPWEGNSGLVLEL